MVNEILQSLWDEHGLKVISALVGLAITMALQWLRSRGLQISAEREAQLQVLAADAATAAEEESARRVRNGQLAMTGGEKHAYAAQQMLAKLKEQRSMIATLIGQLAGGLFKSFKLPSEQTLQSTIDATLPRIGLGATHEGTQVPMPSPQAVIRESAPGKA